ncbi:hypothetical protein ASPACDRAFT_115557 [Aspergillus aculeatus ATCC 16872]|uniref:Uncharacterized protein n=1 Tax=Aspergillus aculeatus (strain ATCC 16872 / CBS 172.66 / WB 5094) TaxID=690307 RepID=A0A1L9X203_ASPA1|nr:uncharacterized protein ASPACDRAFT_115557 [Aspergillus aculeatus ATCC 16872]OJK02530.1 hypothetical protein ASPACDRAFT_115557 [Aspergillus aculeatus ATCC 16872]
MKVPPPRRGESIRNWTHLAALVVALPALTGCALRWSPQDSEGRGHVDTARSTPP